MTKKDFELIGRALKKSRDQISNDVAAVNGVRIAAENTANELASTDPRFDRTRFLETCGLTG